MALKITPIVFSLIATFMLFASIALIAFSVIYFTETRYDNYCKEHGFEEMGSNIPFATSKTDKLISCCKHNIEDLLNLGELIVRNCEVIEWE